MKLHTSSSIRFNMRSAQYLSYMQAFMKRLQALKIDNVMLNEKTAALEQAIKEVENNIRVMVKSSHTQLIKDADYARDTLYAILKTTVKSWSKMRPNISTASASDLEALIEKSDAAVTLAEVIDRYDLNPKTQLDDETGKLHGIVRDMRTEGKEAIEKLHLTMLVDELESVNQLLNQCIAKRAEERGPRKQGALKEARVACDKAYTELEAVINSLLVLAPSAAFSQWVAVQNEDIDRMKLVFKKHKKRAADESESELNDSLLTEEEETETEKG